jgi:hypothetical protein
MNAPFIHVEIEPTNLCNTRCLHCPHEMLGRPKGKMTWDTYQKVMDKVTGYTPGFSVEYAGMGEPLLNTSVYDFIRYVSGKGSTTLTTNASALTPQNSKRLIEAGLAGLTISFNGDGPELYETMMGGLSFQRAQQNLRTAVELSQGTRTVVAANVSVTKQLQPRLASIKQYLNEAGVTRIFYSKCHSRGGFLKGDLVCDTPMPPAAQERCDIFASTLFVAWTGEVLSCCHDLAGANVLGDLNNDPLETILEKKQQIMAGGMPFKICGFCNDLYRFMGDQTFDGRSIAEWVYDLYTGGDQTPDAALSPLSEWLTSIYAREGKAQQITATLAARTRQVTRQADEMQHALGALEEENRQLKDSNQTLEAQNQTLGAQNQTLAAENQGLKDENRSLAGQIEAVRASRTWRLLDRINRFRRGLFPPGK